MYSGIVVGRVWASKKLDKLPPGGLLEIELNRSKKRIIAFDPLSCGDGEKVLVVTGSVASQQFNQACIDAVIVASLEDQNT